MGLTSRGDKLWLKDFLPISLPKAARVMLFAYNSSPSIGATAIKLDDHAKNLLLWLNIRRKDAPRRPLVFICHSLGGLVVKELDKTYTSIIESTCLLVFFATPHQGGNHASFGDIMTKIVRMALQKPRNDLLKALEQNSGEAARRFEQSRHHADKYLVIVDRRSATLNLPGTREKQVAIDADHSTICKLDSLDSKITRALEIPQNS
ncbi:hypothetical protein BGZ60DRAFT_469799 [Tricladium varicosporioides]|nr:hypothetical protein BGZ60DRAFT_469799 [Hymenoscyphus varicosporioides]